MADMTKEKTEVFSLFGGKNAFQRRLVTGVWKAKMTLGLSCDHIDQSCRLGDYSWNKENKFPSWSEIEADNSKITGVIFRKVCQFFRWPLEKALTSDELEKLVALDWDKVVPIAGLGNPVHRLQESEISRFSCVVGLFSAF